MPKSKLSRDITISEQTIDSPHEGQLLAAVDLGSNSFHMVVARLTLGQLRIVDRIKEMVRLANGLDGNGALRPDVMPRALECLGRFGQRLRTIPPDRVRAIATNTVRQLRNPQTFLLPAETALGHGIEVVSGREEARLVYLGVAHGNPPKTKRRLVIDIGGGSTEFIIGEGYQPIERESLQMGCVATTKRFFPNGKLSGKRWKEAQTEMAAEFQQFATAYHALGWQESLGSSGTIKAIGDIAVAMKLSKGSITDQALAQISDTLLKADSIDEINLPGLSDDRKPVIAGGILILSVAFAELGIKKMQVSQYAMREGILADLLGRTQSQDQRDLSIDALAKRYATDKIQARRVEKTVLNLFDQVSQSWSLDDDDRLMLGWSAQLHELGLAIAHSQYHVHGAYLVEHSDIAGFSSTEQQFLAALIRNHRRGIQLSVFEALPDRLVPAALRCSLLLRLAVLLHRSHDGEKLPSIKLSIDGNCIQLELPKRWLEQHPLTYADINTEQDHLKSVGYQLDIRKH